MNDLMQHPECAAFLNAILADPDADLPRLVFADWLDEHGQSERAEFIRVQIEIARICGGRLLSPYSDEMTAALEEIEPWRELERRLLAEFGPKWYEEFGRQITGGTECATWSVEGPQPNGWMVFGGDWPVQKMPFGRGFVNRFTCHFRWWLRHGRAVVARQPITDVIVIGKNPVLSVFRNQPAGCRFLWVLDERNGDPSSIPMEVFRHLRVEAAERQGADWCGYPSEQKAAEALSEAMLTAAKLARAGEAVKPNP